VFNKDTKVAYSPQYTACVAVLLYKALLQCRLIVGDDVTCNGCIRYGKYNVPNGHTLSVSTEHCLHLIYWYSSYNLLLPDSWTKKLCDEANCIGISSPDEVAKKLQNCIFKCREKKSIGSPKSVKV
jgi:hypothetical protein